MNMTATSVYNFSMKRRAKFEDQLKKIEENPYTGKSKAQAKARQEKIDLLKIIIHEHDVICKYVQTSKDFS